LNDIYDKSKEAHSLDKRRLFVRLKKYYFKERILQYGTETMDRLVKQSQSLPFQQMHLTEKWDESWRDQSNPELWRSPMSYLAKVIGKVSLTAPELAKSYLTEPELRGQMTMFTLDKRELEKLNSDILSDPQKYEMIFEGTNLPERDTGIAFIHWDRDLGKEKHDELEHWFRIMNDGYCPIDQLPFAQEFREYKHWVDQIELRSLSTLRSAVNKLLLDHEQTTEFKKGGLAKLQNLVHRSNLTANAQKKE
jgi:hypothetical protein